MTIPRLTVIPAGAGSGKTYTIQKTLANWVVSGEVAPDRILAVTFTEAAASELKGRIRYELIAQGRIDDALRLEQSYISTIHSFGLRVLTEFAFEGGLSPKPRHLDDSEKGLLIRKGLSRTDKADSVEKELTRFGYIWDRSTGESGEEKFRNTLLGLIDRLRTLGVRGEDPSLVTMAVRRMADGYGPVGTASALDKMLLSAIRHLLKAYPVNLSTTFERTANKTAFEQFSKNFRDMNRAVNRPEELGREWNLWTGLQEVRFKGRSVDVPSGYKEAAEAVMAAAAEFPRHPGPLAEAQTHVRALLESAQEIVVHYAAGKKEDSILDYADMVTGARDLMVARPAVLAHLKGRIDCLVIDEFQDTNPMQFALLWELHDSGVPALVVGDLKQAIMGFQNADPRLFKALRDRNPKACAPLTGNWRSTKEVMDWVNAVGPILFGDDYTRLAPKASIESTMDPLEVVDAPGYMSKIARASWTALRIRDLLADLKQSVWDKKEEARRCLRGGDVAVLCPTHVLAAEYAGALRALGIRTRITQDGWYASPAVQAVCHALEYLVDPDDRHAALYLAATELGGHTLSSALASLDGKEKIDDPILEKLNELRNECRGLSPDSVLTLVIDRLDLYGVLSTWDGALQARANLLRLQAEAGRFRDANRQILIAGGYYGAGIKTFLSWLAARIMEKDGDSQPDPRVVDADAVVVTTWHAAKGLEWPVVAVCGMHRDVKPRYPHMAIDWENLDDFTDLMSKARLDITPKFPAEETNKRFFGSLQAAEEEAARRLLYVAVTRAREKVILEWPSYYATKGEMTNCWTLLTRGNDIRLDKDAMVIGKKSFPCIISSASKTVATEVEAGAGAWVAEPLPILGRRAIEYRALPAGLVPEAITPSSLHALDETTPVTGVVIESFAPPIKVDVGGGPAERGKLLHRCFELLGPGGTGPENLASAIGMPLSKEQENAIRGGIHRFYDWLTKRFAPVGISREVPLLGLDCRGSVVSGAMDLLVETAGGYWVLDHKSDVTDDREGRFNVYLPQLRSYADLVRKAIPGKPVLGVGIHWISYGAVSLLPEGVTT